MFKVYMIVSFLAVVGVARAGILPAAGPLAVAQPVFGRHVDEYDPHPQYNFAYEVQDALTGDSKNQVEARDGDVVQGQYSLIDADGYQRIVDYTADSVNGFNALVRREPLGLKTAAIAPTIVKNAPLPLAASPFTSYADSVPALIKSSPIGSHGIAPALVRSTPLAFTSAPALATAGYAGYNGYSGYAGYAAPSIIRSASPALIKSAPVVSYASSPSVYNNAHAAQLASSTIVKTAYSSPIASYHY